MINAKEEFLEHIGNLKVKCALLNWKPYFIEQELDKIFNKEKSKKYEDKSKSINLFKNYTEKDYISFLADLDFDYRNGHGLQELFGTIWFEDGTWSTRGEYEGKEWWEHNILPEIPKELI
jgi:hypothetical protein